MKLSISKAILAAGILSLLAVSITDARQRGAPQQPGALPKLTKVRDDIYLIENAGQTVAEIGTYGGNITLALTDEGVIAVDSKNERIHEDVLAKIKSLTPQPVKYLVLTHNHADHAAGAAMFASEGAQVLITTADRENMAKARNPGWLPQWTYAGKATLFLGGKQAQLMEYRGHTRGDTGPSKAVVSLARGADLLVSEMIDVDALLGGMGRGARATAPNATPRGSNGICTPII